jgi:N-acetylmuramoyl-L-alanine amidase
LVFAIGLAGLLWRFAGIEGSGEAPAAAVAPVIAPVIAPADLMEIETLLDQLGFPPGPLDGVIDAESIAAIHDFQATAGLPVDGAPSAALLEELRAALAELSGG